LIERGASISFESKKVSFFITLDSLDQKYNEVCGMMMFLVQGDTLLHKAASGGNEAICRFLLRKHKADVNAKNFEVKRLSVQISD
jgi:hypothetical protein